jgi:hypothetical protein
VTDISVTAGEESSRAAYLRNLDRELESSPDAEKEDKVEEVATRSLSSSGTPSRAASHSTASNGEHPEHRNVIRFEDGDLENPNNCT